MYNPFVYHLDLCTLAYQLYGQTLVWPMDPYYEQMARTRSNRRDNFMSKVRIDHTDIPPHLDPIVYDFNRINPWVPGVTRPEQKEWILYKTPSYITDKIKEVYLFEDDETLDFKSTNLSTFAPAGITGNDILYGFTGFTGATDNTSYFGGTAYKLPPQKSLMGFVLLRHLDNGTDYDVHITFRGSRSGDAARAALQGFFSARGNADWVTDTNFRKTVNNTFIVDTPNAKVSLGFSLSINDTMMPIIKILDTISLDKGKDPNQIYVAGHSLGGALAAQYTHANLFGSEYGELANQKNYMGEECREWPWERIECYTFSAPTVGNESFQTGFNLRIPSWRLRIDKDPITQKMKNFHVGNDVEIPCAINYSKLDKFNYHEPYLIRRELINELRRLNNDIDGIPANNASTDPLNKKDPIWQEDEPYQLYPNFDSLFTSPTGLNGNEATVKNILPNNRGIDSKNFNENLRQYLIYLKSTYGENSTYNTRVSFSKSEYQDKIQLLIDVVDKTLGAEVPFVELFEAWNDAAYYIKGSTSNHLGVCIIFCAISSDIPDVYATYKTTYPDLFSCLTNSFNPSN